MTRKTTTAAAAMSVVAAITAATTLPSLTGAQTTDERTITVRMKVTAGA